VTGARERELSDSVLPTPHGADREMFTLSSVNAQGGGRECNEIRRAASL
jgi:hypothetical protein